MVEVGEAKVSNLQGGTNVQGHAKAWAGLPLSCPSQTPGKPRPQQKKRLPMTPTPHWALSTQLRPGRKSPRKLCQ